MLANGATLGYKKKGAAGDFADLPGLKEIPDMGIEPEKVENTCLTDENKIYENGIGDLGDMTYKFKYYNIGADAPYRKMREAQSSSDVLTFQEKLSDGTVSEFDASVTVKRTGAGVNGIIDFDLSMAMQSAIRYTDPV